MFSETDQMIRINVSHSHTKTILAEQRFYKSTKVYDFKLAICKKYGTLPEYMTLKLIKNGKDCGQISNDDFTLGNYQIEDFDFIHVIDNNAHSILVQNDFDDVSTVKKYEISEEEYNKREDSVRKFRKKLQTDPEYIKMIKENKGETYEEEASKLEIGKRCILGDGIRRGEIKYIGLISSLGYGFFVGVKLDDPLGDSDGTSKNKKLFECDKNFGIFVRPNYVKMGDFPPVNEFNEFEDEI